MATLFRPIGAAELELIAGSGYTRFPPRLPEQPIFYPVLTEEYAIKIARDWNAKEPAGIGYVTRFYVNDEYINKFELQSAGGNAHLEYWIPADDLDEFNSNIVGLIEVIHEFRGGE